MWKWAVRILLLLSIAAALGMQWSRLNKVAEGMDIYQWWLIPAAMNQTTDGNIYSVKSRLEMYHAGSAMITPETPRELAAHNVRRTVDTFSTPFFYAVYRPFSWLSFEAAYQTSFFLLAGAMIFSVLLMCRMLEFEWNSSLAILLAVIAGCFPFEVDLNVGNVTSLQLLSVVIYGWMRSRAERWIHGVPAGLVLGLAVMFKPTLAAVVVCLAAWWIFRREFRTLAEQASGCAIGAAIAGLYSLTMFPAQAWVEWIHAVSNLRVILHHNNLSLYRLIESMGAQDGVKCLPFMTMGAAIGATWKLRHTHEKNVELLIAGLALGAVLVGAALVWVQYLLLAIPLVIWALRSSRDRRLIALWGIALVATLIVFRTPARAFFPDISLGLRIGMIDLAIIALATVAVIVVMKSTPTTVAQEAHAPALAEKPAENKSALRRRFLR